MDRNDQSNPVTTLSAEEVGQVSGGVYAAIQPWAIGTSGKLQAAIIAKLELLGNPIVH